MRLPVLRALAGAPAGACRADIFTKSLTQEKFERFRETIRGAVTYKDMVSREIELSEQRLKTKEKQVKGKSINLMTLQTNPRRIPRVAS